MIEYSTEIRILTNMQISDPVSFTADTKRKIVDLNRVKRIGYHKSLGYPVIRPHPNRDVIQ